MAQETLPKYMQEATYMKKLTSSALSHLAKLRLFRPDAITGEVDRRRLDLLISEMPGYISFLEEVLASAKKEALK